MSQNHIFASFSSLKPGQYRAKTFKLWKFYIDGNLYNAESISGKGIKDNYLMIKLFQIFPMKNPK